MKLPRRRPHPAQSSRILAAGLSVSTMLGLTSAMAAEVAADHAASAEAPSTPASPAVGAAVVSPRATAAPTPVKVVIVRKYVYAAPTSKPTKPSVTRTSKVPVSKATKAPKPARTAAPAQATTKGS